MWAQEAFLLMYVSRDKRRIDFRGLTGSQRTPRVWGVTPGSEITEIGFKIIKIVNPENSVLLSELRSDLLETIQTDSISLRFSFARLYDIFRTFSYFQPNFRKISA